MPTAIPLACDLQVVIYPTTCKRGDGSHEQYANDASYGSLLACPGAPGLVRSKDLWLPFGDIIVQAETTQFRVNRDVLATHSVVFKQMFDVVPVRPASSGPNVVVVTDSAKDWEIILKMMYDAFTSKTALELEELAAILRLGRKYEITRAKEDAVARIHYEFPCDSSTFEALNPDLTRIKYRPGIYADLLSLAYECGVYSSVPVLAFCCLRNESLATIFSGIPRGDGSFATLPHELLHMLAVARDRLALYQHEALVWLRDNRLIPHASCASRTRCTQQRTLMGLIVDEDHCRLGHFDLGYTIDRWDERWTGMLCWLCEGAAQAVYEKGREKRWELLPASFGMADWDKLIDEV